MDESVWVKDVVLGEMRMENESVWVRDVDEVWSGVVGGGSEMEDEKVKVDECVRDERVQVGEYVNVVAVSRIWAQRQAPASVSSSRRPWDLKLIG